MYRKDSKSSIRYRLSRCDIRETGKRDVVAVVGVVIGTIEKKAKHHASHQGDSNKCHHIKKPKVITKVIII